MPQLQFVTLDVFTTERYAGNPLAVVRVPEGQHVSTEQMQKMAREFNLSETIFLHDATTGVDGTQEWRVRIFLTRAEIPFAGHPTIGAAVYALGNPRDTSPPSRAGRLITHAGPMDVTFSHYTGMATVSIAHHFHEHTQTRFTTEDVRALQPALEDLALSLRNFAVVSPVKGMNFVVVELPTLAALAAVTTTSMSPRPRLDAGWDLGFSGSYFYVYTSSKKTRRNSGDDGDDGDHDHDHNNDDDNGDDAPIKLQTRMIEGPLEDPATGSAACALACYLALGRGRDRRSSSRLARFALTQGVEMGRKSGIEVTVTLSSDGKSVAKVELAGTAVKVMEGVVEY